MAECVKIWSNKPPFTLKCDDKGTCRDLFDAQGNKVTGKCTLVLVTMGNKKPANFECVCIYEPKGSKCALAVVDKGKQNERAECIGECPTLFSKKPAPGDTPDVEGQCQTIGVPLPGGGYEFKCVCTYI